MTFGPSGSSPLRGARARHVRRAALVAGGVGVAVALAACTATGATQTGAHGSDVADPSASPSSSAQAQPAVITDDLTAHSKINPVTPISVQVAHGKLTSLTMTNQSGKHVTGAMGSGDTSWHTTEVLGYGKTYTIAAKAVNADGTTATHTDRFTTLDPSDTADADLERMGQYGLDSGATYGVGIIPMIHFSAPVKNEAEVQRHLQVVTSPNVAGVWSWRDDTDVAYRPRTYWPSGTKVEVKAMVYGVDLGGGTYGASDETANFTVGRKQITVADDNAPEGVDKVRVYNAAGQVLRTMDTSMGQHTGETVDGQYINFYTLNGTYTVLDHENPAIMSSQSYGLPQNAPNGYGKISVPYSTKISVDGIYLHEYNSTIYEQEHGEDVSEGCLNLKTSDAKWFFNHSMVGDPVVVHGAKGAPEIQPWEGGYWSIPWSKWVAGSATT